MKENENTHLSSIKYFCVTIVGASLRYHLSTTSHLNSDAPAPNDNERVLQYFNIVSFQLS